MVRATPVKLGDLGVGAVREPAVQVLLGGVAGSALEDRAQVLGCDPAQPDLLVDVAGCQREDPVPTAFGEPISAPAQ